MCRGPTVKDDGTEVIAKVRAESREIVALD